MFMTKLKIGAALAAAAGILTGIVGGSLNSVSLAQDTIVAQSTATRAAAPQKTESDEEFIRRMSKDLRGVEPTPTEIHFFVANKGANRRQKLIDLFIQERQAKEQQAKEQAAAQKKKALFSVLVSEAELGVDHLLVQIEPRVTSQVQLAGKRRLVTLQDDLFHELNLAAKEKKEVAAITQKYLDQLQEYVKAHPKNDDVADAMQQIVLIYRSQGKTVEADAWRAKLLKEHPHSPAAKAVRQTSSAAPSIWVDFSNLDPAQPGMPLSYGNQLFFNTTPLQPNASIYQPYLNQTRINQPYPSTLQPYVNQDLHPPAPKNKEAKDKQK